MFELLTAEYLFDPQGQGELFSKDDDHMAQIIELLGDFPLEAKMGGKYSRELFDHTGCFCFRFFYIGTFSLTEYIRFLAIHSIPETMAIETRHDREISVF